MSDNFKRYVTSSAFRIELSKKMIDVLLCVAHERFPDCVNMASYHALVKRGLIKHKMRPSKNNDDWTGAGWKLTAAGQHLVELLRLAGFSIDNVVSHPRSILK